MKNRSIVFKLFLLTSTLFTIIFLLFSRTISILEKFYINKKVKTVQTAFEKFVDNYDKSDKSYEQVRKLKQEFHDKTNADMQFWILTVLLKVITITISMYLIPIIINSIPFHSTIF